MTLTNYQDILTLNFPVTKTKEDGFLDLIGHSYKENSISKIYSYFLDLNKNKEVAFLFITSLLELIYEKSQGQFLLEDHNCTTEFQTLKDGRIDLLLQSKCDDSAIIIENKIYHWLANDLEDYWNSISEKNKIGIVLTLQAQEIQAKFKSRYLNITHIEWMQKIKNKGLPASLPLKQYIYINDFIENMIELTSSNEISESARFYFENTEKILKAIETHTAAKKFINAQLEIVAGNVGWVHEGQNSTYRYIWDEKNNNEKVCYVIFIDSLLIPNPNVTILIEFNKESIANELELVKTVENLAEYKNLDKGKNGGADWKHFVAKTYDLKTEDIVNLSSFLTIRIKNDFQPVMDKLLSI